jgi:Tfp pilus assembly protein PilF
LQTGKLEDAERNLNKALHYRGDSAVAHLILARLYAARHQTAREQQQLGEALRFDPYLLAARSRLCELLAQASSGQAALDLIDGVPASQKDTVTVITQRNRVLISMKNYAEARKGVDRGLQIAPTQELLMQDAILKLDQRDYDSGRAILATVLLRDPANLRALDLLYRSYRAEKRDSEGQVVLMTYALKKPDSAPLQYFVAKQLLDAGQRDGARQQLAAAKGADPKFLPADIALAEMDLADHHLDAARKGVSAVLAAEPKNVGALFLLGNIEDEAGNAKIAREQYRKIVQIDHQNVLALNNLAFHLADDPKTSVEALPYAQQAVELAPDSPEIRDTLGWAYYQAGRYGDALKQFESATAKGGTPQWKYHLAMAYAKTGDVERATKIVSSLAEKYHNTPEAKMAERLLVESARER